MGYFRTSGMKLYIIIFVSEKKIIGSVGRWLAVNLDDDG